MEELLKETNNKYFCRIYLKSITEKFVEEEEPECMWGRGCRNCSFREKPTKIKNI